MRIAQLYSHLNGYEYIQFHHKDLWDELENAINLIDANRFIKISNDKVRKGKQLYDQKALNREFENLLYPLGWQQKKIYYYVSDDIDITRRTINILDKEEQKRAIEDLGHQAFISNNEVDFVKDGIALEVQFGKYFSVAYDLHVKHTFFFLRGDINVGIELMPTKEMCKKMDTGVAWFETEVANVIREGRSNPQVPIVMLGIEPEQILI